MSLINQMLQDLEQRSGSAAKPVPLDGGVRAVPLAGRSPAALLAGAGALVAVAAVGGWMFMQAKASPASPPPAATLVLPLPPAAVAPPANTAPAADAAAATRPAEPAPAKAQSVASAAEPKRPVGPQPVIVQASELALAAGSGVSKKAARPTLEEPAALAPADKAPPPAAALAVEARPQKKVSPQQQSDNLYRQAVVQVQQGHGGEARKLLQRALALEPLNVRVRQLLVGLLVEGGNLDEASEQLREGLRLSPDQSGFAMTLARLQLESGDAKTALRTLEQGLKSAGDDPAYHAFYAAVQQRDERHEEAMRHYLVALRSDPSEPTWLVGIGISLQALGKNADAVEAFARARDTGRLNPQLARFVDQRLGQLARQ